ncbi:hypothetical protein [Brassicibacter mesophilus]|uniref:hypothetical protein n=1 Tax=Brassicibacter mesophilus TaxID=745119 RepID=UPI003D19F7CA
MISFKKLRVVILSIMGSWEKNGGTKMSYSVCIAALLGLIVGLIITSVTIYQIFKKQKKPFKTLGISVIISSLSIPFLINELYKFGYATGKAYHTLWEAKDVLSFYGSFLTFLGTAALGALALWQNQKFKEENDISQLKLEQINNKFLDLKRRRENEKLFEIYFSYLNETEKIFNPNYILGMPEENRGDLNVYLILKSCHINILSIKRRLMFLDKCNSDNEFFKYIEDRANEILNIAMKNKDKTKMISQLFEFWKNNYEYFNQKSLHFMLEIYKSIFKENLKNN